MTDKCEHGAERERHKDWEKGLAFTEPLHPCSCCGTLFYYMESWQGWMLADGTELSGGSVYEPKDRCTSCGGSYRWEGATEEEMGWRHMCNRCNKLFKPSELAGHQCVGTT